MYRSLWVAALLAAGSACPVLAQNKPVSVVSGAGSLLTPVPPSNVINDGAFLPETTNYSAPSAATGSLRWNTALAGSTVLEIQLGDLYTIDGIIVQADDNDNLSITYLDSSNIFQPLYSVDVLSVGLGFRTRPNADQSTFASLSAIDTSAIRITDAGGDGFYGISEIQLRGALVPEPASLTVLAFSGLLLRRRCHLSR
jgi:hypothetical protein